MSSNSIETLDYSDIVDLLSMQLYLSMSEFGLFGGKRKTYTLADTSKRTSQGEHRMLQIWAYIAPSRVE